MERGLLRLQVQGEAFFRVPAPPGQEQVQEVNVVPPPVVSADSVITCDLFNTPVNFEGGKISALLAVAVFGPVDS